MLTAIRRVLAWESHASEAMTQKFVGGGTLEKGIREVSLEKRFGEEIVRILNLDRERMGRELQDGLCQELAAIAALSAALARRLAPVAARESAAAREIGRLVRQSIQRALALARELRSLRSASKKPHRHSERSSGGPRWRRGKVGVGGRAGME